MKRYRRLLLVMPMAIVFSACGPGQFLGPTITPLPTFTPTSTQTHTPLPTLTNTPTWTIVPTQTQTPTEIPNLDSGLLSSDWPMDGHDSQRTGFNSQESILYPPLKVLWRKNFGNYFPEKITELDGKIAVSGMGSPTINQIYMLDAKTRNVIWGYVLPNGGIGSMGIAPAQNFSSIFFGGQNDSSLYSLDRKNGKVNWQFGGISTLHASQLVILDNYLLVPDAYTGIAALNPQTGEIIWGEFSGGNGLPVAINKDKVFGVEHRNVLIAKNILTGEDLWKITGLSTYFPRITIEGQYIYFNYSNRNNDSSNINNDIWCANIENGDIKWKVRLNVKSISLPPDFVLAYNKLFIPIRANQDNNGGVIALDVKDGKELWSFNIDSQGVSGMAVANRTLYFIGGDSTTLYALDTDSGKLLWSYTLYGGSGDVIIANHVLYVTSGGSISALGN